NASIPFMMLPILTRFLTPEQYGEVAMYQTWIGALNAVLGLSLHGAAVRKFYDADLRAGELAEFIGACFQILLISNILVTCFVLSLNAHLSQLTGLKTVWLLAGIVAT